MGLVTRTTIVLDPGASVQRAVTGTLVIQPISTRRAAARGRRAGPGRGEAAAVRRAAVVIETVEEALDVLREHGDEAKVLAGAEPRPRCPPICGGPAPPARRRRTCRRAARDRGRWEITVGATTAQADLEVDAAVAARAVLRRRSGTSAATRTRGTVGGSITVHADPAAELPALLVAARVRSSARGEREIDADDLFVAPFSTSLSPDELLLDVRFAPPRRGGAGFAEISRRHGDFAIAAAAVALALDNRDAIALWRDLRWSRGDTGPGDRSRASGRRRQAGEAGQADEVRELVASELAPFSDVHATVAYRKRVGGVLAARALAQAAAGARACGSSSGRG